MTFKIKRHFLVPRYVCDKIFEKIRSLFSRDMRQTVSPISQC